MRRWRQQRRGAQAGKRTAEEPAARQRHCSLRAIPPRAESLTQMRGCACITAHSGRLDRDPPIRFWEAAISKQERFAADVCAMIRRILSVLPPDLGNYPFLFAKQDTY